MKRLSTIRPLIRSTATFIFLSLLVALSLPGQAQTADTLNQVKKIYVDVYDGKSDATEMRQRLIDSLRKTPSLEVVADQAKADAILKARGETWVRAYISVNPRSASSYPVYGGFLSAQLIGKDGEPLWSYLVTPRKYPSSGVRQDLADQLARKLLAALHDSAAPATDAGRSAQSSIRVLKVAGATFPAPLYQAWIESFRQHHPDIQITYNGIGSEAGIAQLRDGKITFAASDVPLSDARMADMPSKVLQFATAIGAIVPIYHLPGVGRDLRFTPEVLAGIYMRKIRNWSDPAIKAINHGVTLPDAAIVVVHRDDGSGTTFAWTDFLSKTSPEWKSAVGSGTAVAWPIGQGAQGNEGVASMVDQTPNSIGYTELTYAIQRALSYGTVRNAAGNFTQANLASLAAAAASASTHESNNIYSSLANAPGKAAYPITSFTWLLVPESIPDAATKSAVAEFLDWILTTGQKESSGLAYNPLPKDVVARQLQMLATFKAK
jgi:phosphate transport system substrate-binding protein